MPGHRNFYLPIAPHSRLAARAHAAAGTGAQPRGALFSSAAPGARGGAAGPGLRQPCGPAPTPRRCRAADNGGRQPRARRAEAAVTHRTRSEPSRRRRRGGPGGRRGLAGRRGAGIGAAALASAAERTCNTSWARGCQGAPRHRRPLPLAAAGRGGAERGGRSPRRRGGQGPGEKADDGRGRAASGGELPAPAPPSRPRSRCRPPPRGAILRRHTTRLPPAAAGGTVPMATRPARRPPGHKGKRRPLARGGRRGFPGRRRGRWPSPPSPSHVRGAGSARPVPRVPAGAVPDDSFPPRRFSVETAAGYRAAPRGAAQQGRPVPPQPWQGCA